MQDWTLVGAAPNIERAGVVCGFLITPSSAGLAVYVYPGVLFAQGQMWRPMAVQNPPPVPASQQSWLWYNSASGLYWTNAPTALNEGDAFTGWVKADATRIVAVSRQEIRVPAEETNVTVIPMGQTLPAGPGGGANTYGDTDVAPAPVFTVGVGRGKLASSPISFEDYANTRSISEGIFRALYCDELEAHKGTLTADVTAEATVFPVDDGAQFEVGSFYLIDFELVSIASKDANNLTVERGQFDSTAAAHWGPKSVTGATNATPIILTCPGHGRSSDLLVDVAGVVGNEAANDCWQVWTPTADTIQLYGSSGSGAYASGGTVAGSRLHLMYDRFAVFAFPPEFFAGEEAANWSGVMDLPNARLVAMQAWMRNAFGDGAVRGVPWADMAGMRTLFGGQIDLEVEGTLGIQSDAVPEITVPYGCRVNFVEAYVSEAPTGAKITAVVKRDGAAWYTLTIKDGETQATGARIGAALAALAAGDLLGLDITGVGTTFPGERLVVRVAL